MVSEPLQEVLSQQDSGKRDGKVCTAGIERSTACPVTDKVIMDKSNYTLYHVQTSDLNCFLTHLITSKLLRS